MAKKKKTTKRSLKKSRSERAEGDLDVTCADGMGNGTHKTILGSVFGGCLIGCLNKQAEERYRSYSPTKTRDLDAQSDASEDLTYDKLIKDFDDEYMNEKKQLYFRGDLSVKIKCARDLPNADGRSIKIKFENFLSRSKTKRKDLSDPYVNICIDDHKIFQTSRISDDLNPVWDETFSTEVSHEGTRMYFWVWDDDPVGKEKLGHASIDLSEIYDKQVITRTLELQTPFKDCKPELEVEVVFEPVTDDVGQFEVTQSYFPLRHTGEVTLYQDACCYQTPAHDQITVHNNPFLARSAWDDISSSIEKAKRFICMTGWSMKHDIRLKRHRTDKTVTESYPTLGEILKRKADEGVQVLILLWNEPFNDENPTQTGIVGTFDERTKDYFSKYTKVNCKLASRQKGCRGILENIVSNTSYSHHQKTVICDDEAASNETVAYLGGLDLTAGRYDDQTHSLFKSTENQHSDDFYQTLPNIDGPNKGPRQPWHDVHARVTGEAARDVLTNFTERWKNESTDHEDNIEALEHMELPKEDKTKYNWKVQIYRSIPVDAAVFDENKRHLLQSKHGRRYEASIHRAWVSGVRNSEKFLYIENQYFLGSAHTWFGKGSHNLDVIQTYFKDAKILKPFAWYQTPRCNHLVPVEIAEQIVQMIEQGKRLVSYIVIPLFPEGDPSAPHVQEMLFWQSKTMSMMYKKIARAIRKMGIDEDPRDYLVFFCLGKREKPPATLSTTKTTNTLVQPSGKHGRSMIYVHSKAMVVDDKYSIVGSANINQRSMDGRRDTEIAVGCWEVGETDDEIVSDGHVQGLRKSLWSEHFGFYEEAFDDPQSLQCVRRVRELASKNWDLYVKDKLPQKDIGHLLLYPIKVHKDSGEIEPATSNKCFPDAPLTAKILGTKSAFLPSRLTV